MNRRKILTLLFLTLFATTGVAAEIDPFIGNYSGSADIESGEELSRRDMSVDISKTKAGFEISWTSTAYKTDGRIKEKEYSVEFVPTLRVGIFSSAMRTNVFGKAVPLNPMNGEPFVWGRVSGNTLTVFSLLIGEDGGYEMQEYNRTLASGGLDLNYQRIRNGEKLKSIRTFLKKK